MKKFKAILSFILSIVICFSVFPTTVFAKTTVKTQNYILSLEPKTNDGSLISSNSANLPISITTTKFTQGQINQAFLVCNVISPIPEDSVVDVTVVFNDGNSFRTQTINELFCCGNYLSNNFEYNSSTGTLHFTFETEGYSFESYDIFSIALSPLDTLSSNANAWFKVTDLKITYTSAENSFRDKLNAMFNDIFGWLKEIRDNLTNIGTNVGN